MDLLAADLPARARAFATAAHAGQRRKGTRLPYVVHPIEVAETLARHYPADVELIAAGYLHDTLEDTATDAVDLEREFGPRVAGLVRGVTAVRGANWRATREGQLAHLAGAPRDVLRLKAADALSNARAIGRDREVHGEAVWKRFAAPPDDVRWYYRSILDRVRGGLGSEPIVALLAAAVERLA